MTIENIDLPTSVYILHSSLRFKNWAHIPKHFQFKWLEFTKLYPHHCSMRLLSLHGCMHIPHFNALNLVGPKKRWNGVTKKVNSLAFNHIPNLHSWKNASGSTHSLLLFQYVGKWVWYCNITFHWIPICFYFNASFIGRIFAIFGDGFSCWKFIT